MPPSSSLALSITTFGVGATLADLILILTEKPWSGQRAHGDADFESCGRGFASRPWEMFWVICRSNLGLG
jgi:hypothetical protein